MRRGFDKRQNAASPCCTERRTGSKSSGNPGRSPEAPHEGQAEAMRGESGAPPSSASRLTRGGTKMLIAAISDTHLPRGRRRIPDACLERLAAADLILHAGDITTTDVLHEIESIGPPVKAGHGNVDSAELRATLPEALELRTPDGARIAMLHDAGPSKRRLERMRTRFPEANAVVFG